VQQQDYMWVFVRQSLPPKGARKKAVSTEKYALPIQRGGGGAL